MSQKITLPIVVLKYCAEPYQRGFYCDDESIRYPFKDSTVSNVNLYIFGFGIPLVTIVIVEAYRTFYFENYVLKKQPNSRLITKKIRCNPYIIRLYYYGGYFLFGVSICIVLTDIGKYALGRLRPHFLDVCKPIGFDGNTACVGYNYITPVDCGSSNSDRIREARLSFPSGHSSFSFYSMTFTVLYIQAQVVWPFISVVIKSTIQFIFICLALLTSLSRVSDYKHHWSDVLAGVALGITVALIVSVYFIGLFRYPKQQIFLEGVIATDVSSIQKVLNGDAKYREAHAQTIQMQNV